MLFFLIKNYKIKHISSKTKIIYFFYCTALNLDKLTKKNIKNVKKAIYMKMNVYQAYKRPKLAGSVSIL